MHAMDDFSNSSPNVTVGARTTADSMQEGRMKVDAGKTRKRKYLKNKIKKYITK